MFSRLFAAAFVALALVLVPAGAGAQTFTFPERSATLFPNPERGWWSYAGGSFHEFSDARAAQLAGQDYRVILGLVRLDAYRDGALPDSFLASLSRSFGTARANGLKVIVRFAYNFPLGPNDSREDTEINTVLGHIRQLGPVITANADTIVAMQGGFIGAWGEGHSSTHDLDSDENKARIRDAIYAAVPKSLNLQWRSPRNLVSWTGDNRMGLHNDCFLANPHDAGTYWGNETTSEMLREAMRKRTARTYFSGETCSVSLPEARMSCADILREGAEYHLASLNRNYYTGFHDRWIAEGCFDSVARKLGYDLRLVAMVVDQQGAVKLRLRNDGWARPIQPRQIVLTTFVNGKQTSRFTLKGNLFQAQPSETLILTGRNVNMVRATRICISAPDTSERLATDVAFSIRFANADSGSKGWNPRLGAYCISGIKRQ